jgi:hypothetical protein
MLRNLSLHMTVIKDPRQSWKVAHKLSDILFLSVVAVIVGAVDFAHEIRKHKQANRSDSHRETIVSGLSLIFS